MDYGIRYDFGTYLRERDGREAAFSVDEADPAAGGHPGGAIYQATCKCNFAKDYPWGFGPRIGVAYRLGENSVVRAGFGIVYAPTNYAQGTVVSDFDSGTPGYGAIIGQLQNGIPSIHPSDLAEFQCLRGSRERYRRYWPGGLGSKRWPAAAAVSMECRAFNAQLTRNTGSRSLLHWETR